MKPRLLLMLMVTGCGGGSSSVSQPVPSPPPPPPPPVACTHTLSWVNPSEDINGDPLEPDELTKATLYVFRIPMAAPEEVDATHDFDAYLLTWTLRDIQAGMYYYRLTVSNEHGESDHSEEVSKECL